MQMQVERLRDALKLLQPVIPKKTTIPVLKNILLTDGEVVATDLEVTVAVGLPEVDGGCLIPHHEVLELLKYVPGDEMLTIESKKKTIDLTWRNGKASYDVAKAEDYPAMPVTRADAEGDVDENRVEGTVDGDSFVKLLTSVVSYCAKEDDRPVLKAVTLCLGEVIEVFAGDGFRMAYQSSTMSFPAEETVLWPARPVYVLEHLWKRSPGAVPLGDSLISQIIGKRELELALGNGMMLTRFGRVSMTTKLIQGTPPDWKQLIPSDPPLKVQVFAGDFERAVLRIKNIAYDAKGIIRLAWTENTMTISAASEEKGKAEATVPVRADGGDGKIALNATYLLEYLKGREGIVTMGATSPQSPATFHHGTSPLVVIMPMFVQW